MQVLIDFVKVGAVVYLRNGREAILEEIFPGRFVGAVIDSHMRVEWCNGGYACSELMSYDIIQVGEWRAESHPRTITQLVPKAVAKPALNVVELAVVNAKPSAVVSDVVGALEDMLAMAKEGHLRSVAIAGVTAKGGVVTLWNCDSGGASTDFAMLGAVSWLKDRMLVGLRNEDE